MSNAKPANKATFRFYAELNDFFNYPEKESDCCYVFSGSPSIKDAIEAQGIPHTEVDLIVVNGESVDFNYHLKDGDYILIGQTTLLFSEKDFDDHESALSHFKKVGERRRSTVVD